MTPLPSLASGAKSPPGAPFPQGIPMPRTEWITQRSGIKTRHWVSDGETGASLARQASLQALAKAGMKASDLDCIVYCTCTPDHFEPGNGVFLQRELGISDVPAIDVRNQCSGFIYGLSVADAWIRTGQYAEKLWVDAPGLAHDPFISAELMEEGKHRAVMEGREVFKYASVLMPQSVATALQANGVTAADVKLLVPHQANLRILEMVQKAVGLRDDQVYVNIQKYGNTTAASIPIALHEALCEGRLKRGDLLVMTALGSV